MIGNCTRKKNRLELINLSADPAEQKNLVRSNPDKVKELSLAYEKWIAKMPDSITGGPKRRESSPKPKVVSENETTLTPREIERARVREARRAAKKAAREKERAAKRTKTNSSNQNQPEAESNR